MNTAKKIVSGVIIAASAGTYALLGIGGDAMVDDTAVSPSVEKRTAAVGSEIKSMRDKHSMTIKRGQGLYEARIYQKPISYQDANGKYRPIDLTVRNSKNPFAKYDKYIDAGLWRAEYNSENPHDYKFTVRGKSIEISALFDSLDVETRYDVDGVKQTVVMKKSDPHTLEWNVDHDASMNATSGNGVRFSDSDGLLFVLKPFVAWDSNNDPVDIVSSFRDHRLKVTVPEGNYSYPIYIDPSVAAASSNLRLDYVQNVWASARIEIAAGNISQTSIVYVGADSVSAGPQVWRLYRPFLSFPIPSGITDVISTDLVFDGLAASTNNSFNVYIVGADTSKTIAEPFTQFDGYVYNDTYTGTVLNDTWTNPGDVDADSTKFSFNAAGIDSVEFEAGDTLHVAMMADFDYSNSEPSVGQANTAKWYVTFDTSAGGGFDPYLSVVYIGSSVVKTALWDSTSSGQINAFDATDYEAARDATSGDANSQTVFNIGQDNTGTNTVFRTFVTVDLSSIPSESVINGVKIYWNGVTDNSTTDFNIWPIASYHSGTVSNDWFNDFHGWAASGAYSPTYYAPFAWSSADYTTNSDSLITNATFIDSVQAAIGDTIRFAMISAEDVAADSAQASEYVRLGGFRLGLFIEPMRPQNFSMTPIAGTTDSILVTWDDYSLDETGYRLIEDVAKTLVAGTDTTAANVETMRVGGLSVNNSYAWRIQIVGGALADSMSAADSTYTNAEIPAVPTISFPADSLLKFIVDPNGNPAWTQFAVQDSSSGQYVDNSTNPSTFGVSEVWKTYAEWGGANGDTVSVGVGKLYRMRAKARSGQD